MAPKLQPRPTRSSARYAIRIAPHDAEHRGINAVLSKPLEQQVLLDEIQHALERSQAAMVERP